MSDGSNRTVSDIGNDTADRQAGEGYKPGDAYPELLHPLPLLERRLDGCMIPIHGFLEGFDLLADLGIDTAAYCDRGISGAVFSYDADRYPTGTPGIFDPRWDGHSYRVEGLNDRRGQPVIPFGPLPTEVPDAPTDHAIWPREFQDPGSFTARGRISGWDNYPEYLEGDFFDLKDIRLGAGLIDTYQPSAALLALCDVYKFWIAFADVDGFRVDTVKHMDPGAARYFGSVIHEFAQTLGKDKFYLIAEIAGGRDHAYVTLETTGLDAALGIDDIPDKLEWIPKGRRNPSDYFDLFRNSILVGKGSHA